MPAERLQKIIAAAGVASRRKAEELIKSGRVQVNGQPVTQLGSKADPEQDHIRVDGKLIEAPERFSYLMLNKPKGYVTTVSDPEKRPTVMDLVRQAKGRVYPVGRLDWASEGLLIMTNDGALANSLMKAASHVAKTYVVKVAGVPDEAKLDKLRAGVSIAEKGGRRVRTAPAQIKLIREGDNPWLEVIIIEGRNRQVRKMFEEVGHHVEKIRRVQYGPLSLDVPPGEFRSLTIEEVAKLKAAASGSKPAQSLHVQRPATAKPPFAKKPSFPEKRDGAQNAEFGKKPAFGGKPKFGNKPSFGRKPAFGRKPSFGKRAAFGQKPSSDDKPTFGNKPSFGRKPAFGSKPTFGKKPAFGGKASFGKKPRIDGKPEFDRNATLGEGRSFERNPLEGNSARPNKPAFGQRWDRSESPSFTRKPGRVEKPSFGRKPARAQRPARFQKPGRKRT